MEVCVECIVDIEGEQLSEETAGIVVHGDASEEGNGDLKPEEDVEALSVAFTLMVGGDGGVVRVLSNEGHILFLLRYYYKLYKLRLRRTLK